jgi:bifunctional DNase/RNase
MKNAAACMISLWILVFVPTATAVAEKGAGKKEGKEKKEKPKKEKDKDGDTVLFMLNSNEPLGTGGYITVISDTAGKTYIPIFIGGAEGEAIDRAVARQRPPRPLTHDLIASIITELGGDVKALTISDLKDNTYIGTLTVMQGKKKHEIDCRPSDGLSIALRMGADIKVAKKVVSQTGLTESEMIQKGYPVKPSKKKPQSI